MKHHLDYEIITTLLIALAARTAEIQLYAFINKLLYSYNATYISFLGDILNIGLGAGIFTGDR
jgi:hypothetical protein